MVEVVVSVVVEIVVVLVVPNRVVVVVVVIKWQTSNPTGQIFSVESSYARHTPDFTHGPTPMLHKSAGHNSVALTVVVVVVVTSRQSMSVFLQLPLPGSAW